MKLTIRVLFFFGFVFACDALAQNTPQTTLPFPQIAVGESSDGYSYVSYITVTNTSASAAKGYVTFGNNSGKPLNVTVTSLLGGVAVTGNQFNFSLPASISTIWEVTADGPITGGWAVVSTDTSQGGSGALIGGTAEYDLVDPKGNLVQAVASGTQGFVQQFSTANIMQGASTGLEIHTAVAILNFSGTPNNLTFELYDSSNTRIGRATQTLEAYGHLAAFSEQIFGLTLPSNNISIGTLKVSGSGLFAAVALLYEGSQVVSMPVIAGTSVTTSITPPAPSSSQPAMTSVSPASGASGGIVSVTLSGTGFDLFTSTPKIAFYDASSSLQGPGDARFQTSNVQVTATRITFAVQIGDNSNFKVAAGQYRIVVRDDIFFPKIQTQTSTITGVNVFSVTSAASTVGTSGTGTTGAKPTITNISPASGGVGATVNVTLTGTNFVAGGTTIQIGATGISVSSVQVSGTTSLTAKFTIASTASAGDRTVNVMTAGGVSNAVTFAVTNSSSQPQMQRLIGTWKLSYTLATGTSTSTVRLSDVRESAPGTWSIYGTVSGDPASATYSSARGMYVLVRPTPLIDFYYIFDFTGTDTVAGCYHQADHGSSALSRCYSMTGVRTSPAP